MAADDTQSPCQGPQPRALQFLRHRLRALSVPVPSARPWSRPRIGAPSIYRSYWNAAESARVGCIMRRYRPCPRPVQDIPDCPSSCEDRPIGGAIVLRGSDIRPPCLLLLPGRLAAQGHQVEACAPLRSMGPYAAASVSKRETRPAGSPRGTCGSGQSARSSTPWPARRCWCNAGEGTTTRCGGTAHWAVAVHGSWQRKRAFLASDMMVIII